MKLGILIQQLRENVTSTATPGASGIWGYGHSFPGPEPGVMRPLGGSGRIAGLWSLDPGEPPPRPHGREREERPWRRKL